MGSLGFRRTFPADAGERASLQCRTTTDLRDRMIAIAVANGRSLSQEIELRLMRSLTGDDVRDTIREEFARYRAEASIVPNMRAEDVEDWLN